MKMRTGYFGTLRDAEAVQQAGYDTIELQVREIMAQDDAQYKDILHRVRGMDITFEVFDNPLPLDVVVADESFDIGYYTDFIRRAVERTAALGARFFVYGNGRTRSLPPDGSVAKNDEMLSIICRLAAEANITVLVEPLAECICNRFLGVAEIYEYARHTGIANLKTLIDYRWFLEGGHALSEIEEYADFIQHIHIDNPRSVFPKRRVVSLKDGHDYAPFLDVVKKLCYKGIISIEANTTDDYEGDLRSGLELLAYHGILPYKANS